MARRVLLLTGHDIGSARKTSMHFLAETFSARGCEVAAVTVGQSWTSQLGRSRRAVPPPYGRWSTLDNGIRRHVFHGWTHPTRASARLGGWLAQALPAWYRARFGRWLARQDLTPDLVLVESGLPVLLVDLIRARYPAARLVYSVSDRLRTLGVHPAVLEAELAFLGHFDLVRVPAASMLDDFPTGCPAAFIPHGLRTSVFHDGLASPYAGANNAVAVGDMLFDQERLAHLAATFPAWTFHLFGNKARLPTAYPNVVEHGEQPFAAIAAYVKFADVGLAPYRFATDADYLCQSSLKLLQYAHCRLPIVAPSFCGADRDYLFTYDDASLAAVADAFAAAIRADRRALRFPPARDWPVVVDELLAALARGSRSVASARPSWGWT